MTTIPASTTTTSILPATRRFPRTEAVESHLILPIDTSATPALPRLDGRDRSRDRALIVAERWPRDQNAQRVLEFLFDRRSTRGPCGNGRAGQGATTISIKK